MNLYCQTSEIINQKAACGFLIGLLLLLFNNLIGKDKKASAIKFAPIFDLESLCENMHVTMQQYMQSLKVFF